MFELIGADGQTFQSPVKGELGGVRSRKLYGTLTCRAAEAAIERGEGTYEKNRVFFLNEESAVAAGYRPCAVCLPDAYGKWKAKPSP